MNIVVLSDTHGNTSFMELVAASLPFHNAEMVYHLGDSYKDGIAFLQKAGIAGTVVPGIYCPEYADPVFENFAVEEVAGKNICLIHNLKEYSQFHSGDDIVFFGHTHQADSFIEGDTWFINPGHLKDWSSKGFEPSYGVLVIDENSLFFEWYRPGKHPECIKTQKLN